MPALLARLARLAAAVTTAAAVFAACAGRRAGPARSARERGPRNEISQAQMLEKGYHSVYDAVEALRNNWLRPRGVDSFSNPGQVLVYFDEGRLGGVESLRGISPQAVTYVRHYDAVSASARWGVGHTQGVIYLSSVPQ